MISEKAAKKHRLHIYKDPFIGHYSHERVHLCMRDCTKNLRERMMTDDQSILPEQKMIVSSET